MQGIIWWYALVKCSSLSILLLSKQWRSPTSQTVTFWFRRLKPSYPLPGFEHVGGQRGQDYARLPDSAHPGTAFLALVRAWLTKWVGCVPGRKTATTVTWTAMQGCGVHVQGGVHGIVKYWWLCKAVSNLRGNSNIERLRELQMDTLEERRKRGDLVQAYRLLSGKDNIFPFTWFQLCQPRWRVLGQLTAKGMPWTTCS